MERITTNGLNMPKLGLGTSPMKGAECTEAVQSALQLGYRHIDTAEMYANEAEVGEGLANSFVPRTEVHLTSKVHPTHLRPEQMQEAMERSLRALRTDYVDLYLIHWPAADMDLPASVAKLVSFKEQGMARAIGVSNFPVALMEQAVATGAPIACNQVEYHALLGQTRVLGYAREHGIAVTAYSPLGRNLLPSYPKLAEIGRKHGASAAQVALKWLYDQEGVVAIPKAAKPENQKKNLQALDLHLDDEDRAAIAALPKDQRQIRPAFEPAWDPPG